MSRVPRYSSTRVNVSRTGLPQHTEFVVRYKKEAANRFWKEQQTFLTELVIDDLQPQTTYEFEVKPLCGTLNGNLTEAVKATTKEQPATDFACGAEPGEFNRDSQEPLPELKWDDYIEAADFDVRVIDMQGSNGTFSGRGLAEMPWLKQIRVRVEFNKIFVNTEYQLIRGGIETIFNPDSKMMVDLDKLKDEDIDEESDQGDNDEEDEFDEEDVIIDSEVDSVTIDESTGDIIVVLEGGGTEVIKPKKDENSGETKDTRITDASGDTWVVKDGKVTKGTGDAGGGKPGTSGQDNLTPQEKLILAILEGFNSDMAAWLAVNGKGPLSEWELKLLEGLPSCLPEDPWTVEAIHGGSEWIVSNTDIGLKPFVAEIQKNEQDWATVSNAVGLDSESQDYKLAEGIVCKYLKKGSYSEPDEGKNLAYKAKFFKIDPFLFDKINRKPLVAPNGKSIQLPEGAVPLTFYAMNEAVAKWHGTLRSWSYKDIEYTAFRAGSSFYFYAPNYYKVQGMSKEDALVKKFTDWNEGSKEASLHIEGYLTRCTYFIKKAGKEIDKGKITTSSCKNNCGKFNVVSNVENGRVKTLAPKLQEKYISRQGISSDIRPKGSYNHVIVKKGMSEEQLEILEEKMFLLYKHTGIYMAVVVMDLENNVLLSNNAADEFAAKLIGEAGLTSEKTVVIVMPKSRFESILGETDQKCGSLGIAQTCGTHADKSKLKANGSPYQNILATYATIAKPYYVDYHFVACDGTRLTLQMSSNTKRKMLPFINDAQLFVSPHKEIIAFKKIEVMGLKKMIEEFEGSYKEQKKNIPTSQDNYDPTAEAKPEQTKQLLKKLKVAQEDLSRSLVTYLEEDIAAFMAKNFKYWSPKKPEVGKLRACYMRDKALALVEKYMLAEMNWFTTWEQLKISSSTSSIRADQLYAYSLMTPFDKMIYGAVDFVGMIPVPPFSDGADLVGLLYSIGRRKKGKIAIYGAGVPMMGVGAAYIKGADDVYFAIAKKGKNGNIEFFIRKTTDVADNELHVFSVFAKNEGEATKVMKESLDFVDDLSVKRLLDKINGLKRGLKTGFKAVGAAEKSFDGMTKATKALLDERPVATANKVWDEVYSSTLWREHLKNAENQVDLVNAWRVIEGNPILRKKPENLESISKWLDEGIEPQKLTDGIAKSRSKQNLINDLGVAKSKLHARVLIKDYDNIPGVAKGRYISNSSSMADKADLPFGWPSDLDIDKGIVETFTGKIEPLELKPGEKIYRVSPAGRQSGTYWTRTKPDKLDDVVGGTAVQPQWNNFEYIHEYVVPEGKTIKTWKGKTARQPVSQTTPSNYHLPGGDEQLYINYIGKQDPGFNSLVKTTKAEW